MPPTYLAALAITLVVEVPIVAAFFRGQALRMAAVAAAATTGTHLAMHHLLPLALASWEQVILVGELGAVLIEGACLAWLSRPRDASTAFLAAAVANSASYAAGLVIW